MGVVEKGTWWWWSFVFVFLSVVCCVRGGGEDGVVIVVVGGDGGGDGVVVSNKVSRREDTTDALDPTPALVGPCSVDQEWCNLMDIPCSNDSDCYNAFPNMDVALTLSEDIPIDPRPICQGGRCSCGRDKCVSQSRTFGRYTIFYYCGPCGWVGSECMTNQNCTHEQSECRGGYCSCLDNGVFYEFSYCEIPYVGYETALQLAIIVCIVIALCFLIASVYTVILSRRLRRGSDRRREREESEDTNEGPPDDTPPTYDDVVDKLPTYQDALEMSAQDHPDDIHSNSSLSSYVNVQRKDDDDDGDGRGATTGDEVRWTRRQRRHRRDREDVFGTTGRNDCHQQTELSFYPAQEESHTTTREDESEGRDDERETTASDGFTPTREQEGQRMAREDGLQETEGRDEMGEARERNANEETEGTQNDGSRRRREGEQNRSTRSNEHRRTRQRTTDSSSISSQSFTRSSLSELRQSATRRPRRRIEPIEAPLQEALEMQTQTQQ